MKKIISVLLLLALSASLCACGNIDVDNTEDTTTSVETIETTTTTETTEITETTETTETTATTETTETTAQTESEEEKALKAIRARYETAKEYLAAYLADGVFSDGEKDHKDNEALEYLYKEFETLGDYEDSAEIFAHFTVRPDVLTTITNTKTDLEGNVTSENIFGGTEYIIIANAQKTPQNVPSPKVSDSKILEADIWWGYVSSYNNTVQYEYDDAGRIISIQLLRDDSLMALITPTYDENDNFISATIQADGKTYTSTYTYDHQNRLLLAREYRYLGSTWTLSSDTYAYDANGRLIEHRYYTEIVGTSIQLNKTTLTYSYDENGNLSQKNRKTTSSGVILSNTSDENWKYEYEYDENGYLIMYKETYSSFDSTAVPILQTQQITQFLYTNDENGRPISAELIETKDGKNAYTSQILTCNYETLYFYDAE